VTEAVDRAGQPLRRSILLRLRTGGPASPSTLATAIGASRTGVLAHLRDLEEAGLVRRESVRHGVGRPRHVYDVTDAAQDLFPTGYDGLASGLLEAVEEVGGEALLAEVLAARRRVLRERIGDRLAARLPAGAPLAERVRELAAVQDEQGYLAHAQVDADGSVRLVEHNCAILRAAAGRPVACAEELALFADVLDARVLRTSHIPAGDRACAYRIEPLHDEEDADRPG
jgi:predicted ArsR family transcriptional regulator